MSLDLIVSIRYTPEEATCVPETIYPLQPAGIFWLEVFNYARKFIPNRKVVFRSLDISPIICHKFFGISEKCISEFSLVVQNKLTRRAKRNAIEFRILYRLLKIKKKENCPNSALRLEGRGMSTSIEISLYLGHQSAMTSAIFGVPITKRGTGALY